jgi:tetratricopeptide (TPR) repeat protein
MGLSANLLTKFVRAVVLQKTSPRFCRVALAAVLVLSIAGCSKESKDWMANLTAGRNCLQAKDYEGAEKSLQAAITSAEGKFGHDAPQTATCMYELGAMYLEEQEYRKAYKIYKALIPIYEKVEPGSAELTKSQEELKKLKKKLKKYHLEQIEDEPNASKKPDEVKSDATENKGASSSDVKKDGEAASSKVDAASSSKSDGK